MVGAIAGEASWIRPDLVAVAGEHVQGSVPLLAGVRVGSDRYGFWSLD